jgi:carboxymethylenebutenolidase
MSGAFVFAAAGQIPDRIAAAASIHGVRLCTKASDSPHLTAAQVRGELYFACAAVDEFAPDSMIEDLKSYLADTAVEHRIETYPNTEHGFVFPTRQGKYHKQSAERHWYRIVDLFRRRCHNSAVAAESVA